MSEDLTLAIKVAMESTSFQKQMADINSQMKLAQAEFANASSKVEGFSNTIAGGKAKVENLTQQLELQKQKVTMYSEAHEKAKATLEKNAQANIDLSNKINATKSAYDASVTATGKNSEESKKLKEELDKLEQKYKTNQNAIVNNQRAVNNYATQLNNAQRDVNNLDRELKTSTEEVEKNGGKWAELKEKLATAGESWSGIGEKVAGAGKIIATGMAVAGASFIGFATAGVTMSDDVNGALIKVQSSTGTTDEAMVGMKDTMLAIYNGGFGESFEDIGTAMGTIAQQSGLTGIELQKVTENALSLRDTFGMEVNESFRSAKMLMDQFGVSADDAYNLIAQGAQNGLDKNGNLLDSVNEYSVQFKQMGFSSEEMFNMFSNGAKSGVFDIDKLGDAVKEFGIRSKDGSKSTTEAFQALGLDAEKLSADFAKGGETGKSAFATVNEALKNCQDPLVQNQVGTALWGTMWEDMGSKSIFALTNTEGSINITKDALSKINAIKFDTFGGAVEGIKRQLSTGILLPLGQEVLPMLNQFGNYLQQNMPTIIGTAKSALNELQFGFKVAKESVGFLIDNFKIISPVIAGVVASFTAFKIVGVVTALMDAWKASTIVATIAQQGLNTALLANPIALTIAAIGVIVGLATVVYQNWEPISKFFVEMWEGAKTGILSFWEWVKGFMANWGVEILAVLVPFIGVPLLIVKHWEEISGALGVVWESIKSVVQVGFMAIVEIVKSAFELITLPFRFIWENCKDVIIQIWDDIKDSLGSAINYIKDDIVMPIFEEISTFINTTFTKVSTFINTTWATIKTTFLNAINYIKDNIVVPIFTSISTFIDTTFNIISTFFNTIWESIKSTFNIIINAINTDIVIPVFTAISTFITTIFNSISTFLTTIWNTIKSTISVAVNYINNDIITPVFTKVKSFVTDTWNAIKTSIETPINAARDTVKAALDAIFGFFRDLKLPEIKIPPIKLPHFSMSGSFSLDPPSVPSFSVDWYAKGGIFNSPSIIGVGEAGQEAVLPINKLDEIMASAIQKANGGASKGIEQTVYIYSPTALSPSETARQNKRALQELALQL